MNICSPCGLPSGIKIEDLKVSNQTGEFVRPLMTDKLNTLGLLISTAVPVYIGRFRDTKVTPIEYLNQPGTKIFVRAAGDLDISTNPVFDVEIPQLDPGLETERWEGVITLESMALLKDYPVVYVGIYTVSGSTEILQDAAGFYNQGGI